MQEYSERWKNPKEATESQRQTKWEVLNREAAGDAETVMVAERRMCDKQQNRQIYRLQHNPNIIFC